MRRYGKALALWYLLLALLAGECASYWAAHLAAGFAREAARREFTAAASRCQEVDKVPYAALINRWAGGDNVSAVLVAAIIQAESSFQPRAMSRAGAAGLMQIIPGTWRHVNSRIGACSGRHAGECGPDCYFQPELNIRIGTAYFAELVGQFEGDLVLAIAAYNAGPGAVTRHGGIPPYPETEEYVARVMANWYELSQRPVPVSVPAVRFSETTRSLAGWALTGTTIPTVWLAGILFRRHRCWRWR